MKNIAIFISGSGTNMASILEACKTKQISAQVSVIICNNPNAKGIEIAKNYNVPVEIIDHKNYINRLEFDKTIINSLKQYKVDLICLAGFMRLVTKSFLEQLTCPIINIHPSLLPAFKGSNAVEDAFNYGVKIAGCSVHFVTEEMDSGKIISQKSVQVEKTDTLTSLKAKILKQEHIAYIEAINELIKP